MSRQGLDSETTSIHPSLVSPAHAPSWNKGGKRGKSGGLKPKRADVSVIDHPIYRELLEIGSKERSLNPWAIRTYDALLKSEDVRRRAGPTTDLDRLAHEASDALRTIVDGITDPIRRLVAQAALCTEPTYEGLRVIQRQEELAKLPEKISAEMFKYHRRKVFESIVRIMDIDSTHVKLQVPESPDSVLLVLASAAANLYYAMLTSIFVTRFSLKLNLVKTHKSSCGLEAREAYAKYAFESFTRFIYEYAYSPAVPTYQLHLPWELIGSLEFILRTIREYGPPFTPEEYEMLCKDLSGKPPGEATSRLFREGWQPWFCDDSQLFEGLPVIPRLELLGAKAEAAARMISKHVSLEELVFSEARTIAHKTLADIYDLDESVPIVDGKSLRYHADTYFDSASAALANSNLVLYDSKSKIWS